MTDIKPLKLPDDEALRSFLDTLNSQYGYDFRNYSSASLKRRVMRLLHQEKLNDPVALLRRIAGNPAYLQSIVNEIMVSVTEMFRDPPFYIALRQLVLPVLATYPFIRIWHAGCASGEEVYSLAILLREAGLLHKSLIYATDINTAALQKAKTGLIKLSQMRQYSAFYQEAGGQGDFSSYYTANYNHARFSDELKQQVVFAVHNLVSDSSFNSFQLILCRNVLIYFNKDLQQRVLKLFDESLEPLGFLGLGAKEHLQFRNVAPRYTPLNNHRIWRKKG